MVMSEVKLALVSIEQEHVSYLSHFSLNTSCRILYSLDYSENYTHTLIVALICSCDACRNRTIYRVHITPSSLFTKYTYHTTAFLRLCYSEIYLVSTCSRAHRLFTVLRAFQYQHMQMKRGALTCLWCDMLSPVESHLGLESMAQQTDLLKVLLPQ